ncbi:MAG: PA14 domain-containing protein [Bryobacteraceae bacterium]
MRSHPLLLLAVASACLRTQETPVATFGTTVAISSGLQGNLYLLSPYTEELPNLKRMRPVGAIYTTSLQIWPRNFQQGFPGITDRFEWFAIDYTGRFWVEKPGVYRFRLLSDDGSKLYINDKTLIDNDGTHAPEAVDGSAHFSRGVHRIRVSYFQGPRSHVALVLSVAGPDTDTWTIFDTNNFQPPTDPDEWLPGKIRNVKQGSNL